MVQISNEYPQTRERTRRGLWLRLQMATAARPSPMHGYGGPPMHDNMGRPVVFPMGEPPTTLTQSCWLSLGYRNLESAHLRPVSSQDSVSGVCRVCSVLDPSPERVPQSFTLRGLLPPKHVNVPRAWIVEVIS